MFYSMDLNPLNTEYLHLDDLSVCVIFYDLYRKTDVDTTAVALSGKRWKARCYFTTYLWIGVDTCNSAPEARVNFKGKCGRLSLLWGASCIAISSQGAVRRQGRGKDCKQLAQAAVKESGLTIEPKQKHLCRAGGLPDRWGGGYGVHKSTALRASGSVWPWGDSLAGT